MLGHGIVGLPALVINRLANEDALLIGASLSTFVLLHMHREISVLHYWGSKGLVEVQRQ